MIVEIVATIRGIKNNSLKLGKVGEIKAVGRHRLKCINMSVL